MKILKIASNASFPDHTVARMTIDHSLRLIRCGLNGIWVDRQLPTGTLVLKEWTACSEKRFNSGTGQWEQVPHRQEELFGTINELEVRGRETILTGFGSATGQWLELSVADARVTYEYD